jgi:hypothetical protein
MRRLMTRLVQRLATSLLAVGLVASIGLPIAASAQTGCPTSGEGISCFGGQYYCAAAQECRTPVTTCPRAGETPPGPQWALQTLSCAACGCACPGGYTQCTSGGNSGFCVQNRNCPAGLTWNVCSDTCTTPYVLLDPATAQTGSVNISGGVTATGNVATGGDIYLPSGKALRVDSTGVTNLNLGNWGVGATGLLLNVFGDLANSGTASLGKETHIGRYNHVLDYASTGTPTYGYKIKTNIPFQNGMQMPTVFFDGYMYGASKAMRVAVSWYVYGDAFNSVSAASGGGYQPTVQLARENGKVVIYLTPPVYYIRFHISAYEFMGTTKDMFEGWTVADEALSGDKVTAVPYTQSLSGDSYFTSGIWNSAGKVGVGTASPSAELQVVPPINTEGLRIIGSNWSPLAIVNAGGSDLFRVDQTGNVTAAGTITGAGFLSGSGTANYVTKFTGTSAIGNSQIFDNGTNVGIGNSAPGSKLTVNGDISGSGNIVATANAQATNDVITVGNGNGVCFWQDCTNYKIHMGTGAEYQYGPVTDYSIKMNMSSNSGRGWTWGQPGAAPVAGLSNTGAMQIAGNFVAAGSVTGTATTGNAVIGSATTGSGVRGTSSSSGNGVSGASASGYGLYGTSTNGAAIVGSSTNSMGIWGVGPTGVNGSGTGATGTGIQGTGAMAGVSGTAGAAGGTGVYGSTSFAGVGVQGTNSASSGATFGVAGYDSSPSGYAVYAANSAGGYGVYSATGVNYFNNSVGIGVPSPTQALDVNGYVKASTGMCIGASCIASWPSGTIGGSGTANYVTKFTAAGTVGNSQLYDAGANVGIGTASPTAKLEIVGGVAGTAPNLKTTGDILIGNATGASIFFDNNYSYATGNYIQATAVNTQTFWTAGTERMRIASNGDVGIGTAYPGGKLGVVTSGAGSVAISGWASGMGVSGTATAVGGSGVYAHNSAASGATYGVQAVDDSSAGYAVYANNTAGGYGVYSAAGSNYFSGNVGVGTTNPAGKLDVECSSGNCIYGYNTGGSGVYGYGVNAGLYGVGGNYGLYAQGGTGVYATGTSYGVYSAAGTNYFAGNVGVGAAPTYKLDVAGGIRSQDYGAGGSVNVMVGDDSYLTDIDVGSMMGLYSASDTTVGGLKLGSGGAYLFGYANRLGINVTSPAASLDVRDAGANTGTIHVGTTGTGGDWKAVKFGDGDYVTIGERDADDQMEIRGGSINLIGGATAVQSFTTTTSNTLCYYDTTRTIAGSSTTMHVITSCTASSRRFKENIKPLDVNISKLLELEPVSFTWKNKHTDAVYENGKLITPASDVPYSNGPGVGLIAEDVAKLIPEIVLYDAQGQVESLDYRLLSVYELNALKDLYVRTASVENGLRELTGQALMLDESGQATVETLEVKGNAKVGGDVVAPRNEWGKGSGWINCPKEGECVCPSGLYITKTKNRGAAIYCSGL